MAVQKTLELDDRKRYLTRKTKTLETRQIRENRNIFSFSICNENKSAIRMIASACKRKIEATCDQSGKSRLSFQALFGICLLIQQW